MVGRRLASIGSCVEPCHRIVTEMAQVVDSRARLLLRPRDCVSDRGDLRFGDAAVVDVEADRAEFVRHGDGHGEAYVSETHDSDYTCIHAETSSVRARSVGVGRGFPQREAADVTMRRRGCTPTRR